MTDTAATNASDAEPAGPEAVHSEAFYHRIDDERFASTELTRGPWDENSQHAGPPSALLGYAVEHRPGARDGMRVARITIDIRKPVPIATLRVSARVLHESRSIEVVEAILAADDGRPVMTAQAVRIRVAGEPVPAVQPVATLADPVALTETPTRFRFKVGYHTAMETRYAAGSFTEPGPATVWFRMRQPLVSGVPIDPLSRVLTAADSGNGVSNVLDFRTYVFINPELTVHLRRYPRGEWVCLDSVSTIEADGIGLADTALHDATGPIGRGTQSLFIAPRR